MSGLRDKCYLIELILLCDGRRVKGEIMEETKIEDASSPAKATDADARVIKVLLADDHPIVMAGFAMSLENFGLVIIGQAKTPQDAVAMYSAQPADVVILDIRFGAQLTGLDAAKQIWQSHPKARIIFLSQFDQDSLIKEAYRMGASAFVTKDCEVAELVMAVRRAHAGELYFMPAIAERLANLSVRGDASPQSLFDERELAIFTLMAEGLTNVEIAEKLALSSKTISNVSQSIKERLGLHRPAEITKLAVKHGLVSP